jgi:hypothetical protein
MKLRCYEIEEDKRGGVGNIKIKINSVAMFSSFHVFLIYKLVITDHGDLTCLEDFGLLRSHCILYFVSCVVAYCLRCECENVGLNLNNK